MQTVYSKKNRESHKNKLQEFCSQNPEAAKSLTLQSAPGRPRLEEQQSELLKKTIVDIAMFGASVEERRRCEVVRTCHTPVSYTHLDVYKRQGVFIGSTEISFHLSHIITVQRRFWEVVSTFNYLT